MKHCFHKTKDILRTPGGVREVCCFCGVFQDRIPIERIEAPKGHGSKHPDAVKHSDLSMGSLESERCAERERDEIFKTRQADQP